MQTLGTLWQHFQRTYVSIKLPFLPSSYIDLLYIAPTAPPSNPSSRQATDGVWIECHHCLPLLPQLNNPTHTGDAFGINIASVVTTDRPFPPVKGGSCLLTGTHIHCLWRLIAVRSHVRDTRNTQIVD